MNDDYNHIEPKQDVICVEMPEIISLMKGEHFTTASGEKIEIVGTQKSVTQTDFVYKSNSSLLSDMVRLVYKSKPFCEHIVNSLKDLFIGVGTWVLPRDDIIQKKKNKQHEVDGLLSQLEVYRGKHQELSSYLEVIKQLWDFEYLEETPHFDGKYVHMRALGDIAMAMNLYRSHSGSQTRHMFTVATDELSILFPAYQTAFYNDKDKVTIITQQLLMQVFNGSNKIRDAFEMIHFQDKDLEFTRGLCIIHYTGNLHYNLVVVKFPSTNIPNGQVYVIDHNKPRGENGQCGHFGETCWYAKICGMYYLHFFGNKQKIYDDVRDMDVTLPSKKSSNEEELKTGQFSRFDMEFLTEKQSKEITKQEDGVMCAAWVALELDSFIRNPDRFLSNDITFHTGSNDNVCAARYYLGSFENTLVEKYLEYQDALNRLLNNDEKNSSIFPEYLQFEGPNTCRGGTIWCKRKNCRLCSDTFPSGQLMKSMIDHKLTDGVFAKMPINKDAYVIPYKGQHVNYTMDMKEFPKYYALISPTVLIDSRNSISVSKYIKHSCSPNCEFKTIRLRGKSKNELWIVARERIEKGTELTVHYNDLGCIENDNWESFFFGPSGCKCNVCAHKKVSSLLHTGKVNLGLFDSTSEMNECNDNNYKGENEKS